MTKVHWSRKGAAQGKAFTVHPLKILGIIFSCIGLGFAVLGGIFMAVSADVLPQVFTSAAWGNDTPDELALPIVGVVFAALGLIFLLTGVVMLLLLRRQSNLREELERYGTRVQGMVSDIRIDRTYQVNGRSPLRIHVSAVHPVSGETVTVRSGPVWETALSTGDPADVLFDPMDEKKRIVVLPE